MLHRFCKLGGGVGAVQKISWNYPFSVFLGRLGLFTIVQVSLLIVLALKIGEPDMGDKTSKPIGKTNINELYK
jgi:hypothetical protein